MWGALEPQDEQDIDSQPPERVTLIYTATALHSLDLAGHSHCQWEQGDALLKPRLLGKTAPQLLRSNSLGAVGPEGWNRHGMLRVQDQSSSVFYHIKGLRRRNCEQR
eukprot:symbB.v1.2.032315.t1/scaffold3866.1/size49044/2